MPGGAVALIRLLALLVLTLAPLSAHAAGAQFLDRFRWGGDDPHHGGFSALDLDDDGTGFVAVSDRGWIVRGRLQRAGVAISGVVLTGEAHLLDPRGHELEFPWQDSEGVAVDGAGRIFVSFEGRHRVWRYDRFGGPATALPTHPDFRGMELNSSLEALAIDRDGALYTLPERSGAPSRPFPLYRFAGNRWTKPFTLPREGGFLPVGADFGPDGRLYLLERRFDGIFGFASRVRRFTLGPEGPVAEETLFTSPNFFNDNLEGLAVWRDGTGAIRLTMIADDNFSIFQHTEFVEYRVTE
ncbi:esterase-like activity of phytase family protein [Oceaniglobus roseus]|uniref:esterase-like activity of phytase family protein n=1 Tax=Oceaniglobus roseus TaxID=1737570 RepID=UPI001FE3F281|nr:esterase-like activity of phytase family protein [Kandeliimicrobium roseum]